VNDGVGCVQPDTYEIDLWLFHHIYRFYGAGHQQA
jgi:hypothetical protein